MKDNKQHSEHTFHNRSELQVVTAKNQQEYNSAGSVPPAPRSAASAVTQPTRPFPVGKLLLIIFGPGAMLVVGLILQIINRFVFTSANGADVENPARVVINLITLVIGFFSIIGIICMPIAVVLLVVYYNSKKNQ